MCTSLYKPAISSRKRRWACTPSAHHTHAKFAGRDSKFSSGHICMRMYSSSAIIFPGTNQFRKWGLASHRGVGAHCLRARPYRAGRGSHISSRLTVASMLGLYRCSGRGIVRRVGSRHRLGTAGCASPRVFGWHMHRVGDRGSRPDIVSYHHRQSFFNTQIVSVPGVAKQESRMNVCMDMCMSTHAGYRRPEKTRRSDLAGVYRDVQVHTHVCTHVCMAVYTDVYTCPYIHLYTCPSLCEGAVPR